MNLHNENQELTQLGLQTQNLCDNPVTSVDVDRQRIFKDTHEQVTLTQFSRTTRKIKDAIYFLAAFHYFQKTNEP